MNVEEARQKVIEVLGEDYVLKRVSFARFAVGHNETADKVAVEIAHIPWPQRFSDDFDFTYDGEGASLEDALSAALGVLK